MRRNDGLAPAELAFEDMPRAAVRFTCFAKTLALTPTLRLALVLTLPLSLGLLVLGLGPVDRSG